MYRKRKRTRTDALVDKEKIKKEIKQELKAEMQNNLLAMLGEWCQVVLSLVSNRASPSPTALKSSYASVDNICLINGTTELTKVHCDDRTQEDLIGMLTKPAHCGLCIMWRGLECEAAIGVVHPEQATLQSVLIHEDCAVVEVLHVYTIFVDEPWNTLLMTR
jgi:hypothetical protein